MNHVWFLYLLHSYTWGGTLVRNAVDKFTVAQYFYNFEVEFKGLITV